MPAALARRRALARLMMAGSGVFFGLMAVLGRMLATGPAHFTPGQLAVVRCGVGVAVSLAVFAVRPSLFRPVNYPLLVARELSGGVVLVLYFAALASIPAGEAGTIYNLFPAIAALMALGPLRERHPGRLWLAIGVATLGVALVLGNGTVRLGLGWGEGAALGAAFFAAVSANVIRAMRGTDNAATIFFFLCLVGLPVVLPFALDPWPVGLVPWALAVVMAISAFAAQVLMAEAYGPLSIGEAATWLQFTPIAQYLIAALLLGESITAMGVVGIAVSISGVAWATRLGQRTPAAVPPA